MTSERKHIAVKRLQYSLNGPDRIECDALNGVGSIPGVSDLRVEAATHDTVVLSYVWTGAEHFSRTDEHLGQFGLQRDWEWELKDSNR